MKHIRIQVRLCDIHPHHTGEALADKEDSKLIEAVSRGWPMILASVKSLLETGEALEATQKWPEGM